MPWRWNPAVERVRASRQDLLDAARPNQAPAEVTPAPEIVYAEKFTDPHDVEENLKSSEARDQGSSHHHH